MPSRLERYQQSGQLHYITFTCFHRRKLLDTESARDAFEHTLERVRRWYSLDVFGYVVMPEHIHILVSEPARSTLAVALQMLKQISARKMKGKAGDSRFWQRRYYDFNVFSQRKFVEKLGYLHRLHAQESSEAGASRKARRLEVGQLLSVFNWN
jgi:putative transposase